LRSGLFLINQFAQQMRAAQRMLTAQAPPVSD
jgi:hypothetical protein